MIKIICRFFILVALALGSTATIAKAEGGKSSCVLALGAVESLSPNLSSKQKNIEIGKILESTEGFKEAEVYKDTLPAYRLEKYTRVLTHKLNSAIYNWKVNRKNRRGKQGADDTRGVYLAPYVKAAATVNNYITALNANKPSFVNKYSEELKPSEVSSDQELSGFSLFEDSMVVLGKEARLRKNWIEKIAIHNFNIKVLENAIELLENGQSTVTLTQITYLEDGVDLLKSTQSITFQEVKKRSSVKKVESGKSNDTKLVMSLKQVLKKKISTEFTYTEEIKGTGFQKDRGDFEALNASVYESLEQLDVLVNAIESLSFDGVSALKILQNEADANPGTVAAEILSLYRGYIEKSTNEDFGLSTYKELEQAESWYYASGIKAEKQNPKFGLVAHGEKAIGVYGEGRHTMSTSESVKNAEKKFLGVPNILLKYPTFVKKVKGVSILLIGASTLGSVSWLGLGNSKVDVSVSEAPAAIVQVVDSAPKISPEKFFEDAGIHFNSEFKALANSIDAKALTDYEKQLWQDWFAQIVDLKKAQAIEYLKSEGINVDEDYESPQVKEIEATIEAVFDVYALNPELVTPAN